MTAPSWFVAELEIIDPTYFCLWHEEYRYWEIKKRMDIDRVDKDNGVHVRLKDPTVAVFKLLNDDALLSLRKRKYIGLKYANNPLKYLADIQARNREARAKARHYAQEMQAEGVERIVNWDKRKMFDTPRQSFQRSEP